MWAQQTAPACLLAALALAGCTRQASQPSLSDPPPHVYTQVIEVPRGGHYVIGHRFPLTDAVSTLQSSRVKALLEGGADPNVREENASSWPPLALAMRGHDTSEMGATARREIMSLLVAHGADVNIRWCETERPRCNERTGVTPLMYAATLGNEKLSDLLVQHGADASLRDWNGLTAADYWGVKPAKRPSTWCVAPRLKETPGPYQQQPILEDANWLLDPSTSSRRAWQATARRWSKRSLRTPIAQ